MGPVDFIVVWGIGSGFAPEFSVSNSSIRAALDGITKKFFSLFVYFLESDDTLCRDIENIPH